MPQRERNQSPPNARINRAWATVQTIHGIRLGLARAMCRLSDGSLAPAVGFSALCGPICPGDRVLLNTTAVDLGLGTGGDHFIIASQGAADTSEEHRGHIVKLRYTPLQMAVLAVEEPASPHHGTMQDADSLFGMPVVCCGLLSQVPAVMAGLRDSDNAPTVAVAVTDEASLPIQYSDLLTDLRRADLVAAITSTGQAFGGDLEAVNLHSGLLAARHVVGADVTIVTPGPGTVGTHTRWGFGGVRQGEAVNAAYALRGRPVAVVRASSADNRARHRGISHHTRAVFERVALAPFVAAWPATSNPSYQSDWDELLAETGERLIGFAVEGAESALERFEHEWRTWRSMGRCRADDPLFFEAGAVAGILARRLWEETAP